MSCTSVSNDHPPSRSGRRRLGTNTTMTFTSKPIIHGYGCMMAAASRYSHSSCKPRPLVTLPPMHTPKRRRLPDAQMVESPDWPVSIQGQRQRRHGTHEDDAKRRCKGLASWVLMASRVAQAFLTIRRLSSWPWARQPHLSLPLTTGQGLRPTGCTPATDKRQTVQHGLFLPILPPLPLRGPDP